MPNGASNTDLPPRSAVNVADEGNESTEFPPTLPGYDILGYLGRGGMGVVWKARQRSTRREVALKVLQAVTSERARQRFCREVELSARLTHPHIARVYESGIENGVFYYAMELVNGEPIDEYVSHHSLDQSAILSLMLPVCTAVQHAHQIGVIHRDIKPSNIIIDKSGEPRVLDFGLAKALQDEWNVGISLDGEIAGTPGFMSPEQAEGASRLTDTRTDVYGLGAVLYLLLTERLPHNVCGGKAEVLHRISQGSIVSPRQFNRRINKDLEALMLKALARDPDARYVSAGDLAIDLKSYLSGEPLRARPATVFALLTRRIRQHARLVALTALVATFIVVTSLIARSVVHRAQANATSALQREALFRRQSEKSLLAEQLQRRVADLQIAEDTIASANTMIERGEWPRAHDRCMEGLREFDRLKLPLLAPAIELSQIEQHVVSPLVSFNSKADLYRAVFYRSNSQGVLVVNSAGELLVLKANGSRHVECLLTRTGPVRRAGFSTEGDFVAAATLFTDSRTHSICTEISVWRTTPLDHLWTQRVDGIANTDLAVLPGGAEIVLGVDGSHAASQAAIVRVAAEPAGIRRLDLPRDQTITSLALSSDGAQVVGCGGGRLVSVRSFPGLTPISSLMLSAGSASALGFVPGTHEVVCGDDEGNLIRWDGVRDSTSRVTAIASSSITSLSFSHAPAILVGTRTGELLNVDTKTLKVSQHLCGHTSPVASEALTDDLQFAASCGDDGSCHIWSLDSTTYSHEVHIDSERIMSMALLPNSSTVAVGTESGKVILIDCSVERVLKRWQIEDPSVPIVSLRFVESTEQIIAADALGRIHQLTPAGSQSTKHVDPGFCSFSADGRFFCRAGARGAQVCSAERSSPDWVVCGSPTSRAATSPNGQFAVTSDANGLIRFWSRDGSKPVSQYRVPEALAEIELSADARKLLLATAQGVVTVIDPMTAEVQRSWPAHTGRIRYFRFLAGAEQAITAGDDGEVRLWDIHSGRLLAIVLKMHGPVNAMAISEDGLRMVAASSAEPGIVSFRNFLNALPGRTPRSFPTTTQPSR